VFTSSRSGTGSNDPVPFQVVHLAPYHGPAEATTEATAKATSEATTEATDSATVMASLNEQRSSQVAGPRRRKIGLKKKLTPKKVATSTPQGAADPSSPAADTRGRKKLHLD